LPAGSDSDRYNTTGLRWLDQKPRLLVITSAPRPQTGSQHPAEAPATSGPTTITRHSRS